jgi:hypothetical protein
MASSGMLRRLALARTDDSEELSASIIRVKRISALGTTLAGTTYGLLEIYSAKTMTASFITLSRPAVRAIAPPPRQTNRSFFGNYQNLILIWHVK